MFILVLNGLQSYKFYALQNFILLVIKSSLLQAQTISINSNIEENQVWEGTIIVEQSIEIVDDVVLEIMPNTVVKIAQNAKTDVYGSLKSVGTKDSPILFTAFNESWGGIEIFDLHKYKVRDTIQIEHTIFEYGLSVDGGCIKIGAYYNRLAKPQINIINSIFRYNQADRGGAIFSIAEDNVKIENCVFHNNHAKEGGAIFISNTDVNFTTFVNNQADIGGAVYPYEFFDGTKTKFTHNILWKNGDEIGYTELFRQDFIPKFCVIKGGYSSSTILNEYPIFEDTLKHDYRVKHSSPAIDSGCLCLPYNEDNSPVDIGAYQYEHREDLPNNWNIIKQDTLSGLITGKNVICNNIIVPENETLVFQEGAEIMMEGVIAINILGTLSSIGSKEKRVILYPRDTTNKNVGNGHLQSGWAGISCSNPDSRVKLQFTDIFDLGVSRHRYAHYDDHYNDKIFIDDGLFFDSLDSLEISNCSFTSCYVDNRNGDEDKAFILRFNKCTDLLFELNLFEIT